MRALLLVLLIAGLSGCLDDSTEADVPVEADTNGDGIVVVAVVDSGVNPYHFDMLAAKMPQHLNSDPSDDLPLDHDVATWMPGFPGAHAFSSYSVLDLSLTMHEDADNDDLHAGDSDQWSKVKQSAGDTIHYATVPGTKVIGLVSFTGSDGYGDTSHGMGSASVSVGNLHGSCPECLLVFVNGPSEQANEWVLKQDWIDVQTNSWGFSTVMRDRMYAGSDTELQREASLRGQTIFFSAGNGQANTFTAPNPTLFSSQEGPDWVITVGAISPAGESYSGHGKPADIASLGTAYPDGRGSTVSSEGSFGGTSNATPVTAGMYAKALYELRKELGSARMQDGVIATGEAGCGPVADCALADGIVTAKELRTALFRSVNYTEGGWGAGLLGTPVPAGTEETEYVAEGHGSTWGRFADDATYAAEVARITGFVKGTWGEEQHPDQVAWMVADSYCRQMVWGTWEDGYYVEGETQLPAADPDWPMRTWLIEQCPTVVGSIVEAERVRDRP